MTDSWDLDTETIRRDEVRATAVLAVARLTRGEPPASDTPLQREVGMLAESAWRRWRIEQMRHRVQP